MCLRRRQKLEKCKERKKIRLREDLEKDARACRRNSGPG